MGTRLHYLMALLPPLPALGEPLPLSFEELLGLLDAERATRPKVLARALRLQQALVQEAHLKLLGFADGDIPGAVSLDPQAPPLLAELLQTGHEEVGEDIWLMQLWTQLLDFIGGVGRTIGSTLLERWADWERSLRLLLIRVRTGAEGEGMAAVPSVATGAASRWTVGAARPDAGREELALIESPHRNRIWYHDEIIGEWRAASDPLAAEKVLDQARIRFIDQESHYYSFEIDELVAYFLKLGILARHARLSREAGRKVLEEVSTL